MVLTIPKCDVSGIIMERFPVDKYHVFYEEGRVWDRGMRSIDNYEVIKIMMTDSHPSKTIVKFIKMNSIVIDDRIMDRIHDIIKPTDLVKSLYLCTGSVFNKYFADIYLWYTPNKPHLSKHKPEGMDMVLTKRGVNESRFSVSYVSEVIIPDDTVVELGQHEIMVDKLNVIYVYDLRSVVQIPCESRELMERFHVAQYKITYLGSKLIGSLSLDLANVIEFLANQPKPDIDLIKKIILNNYKKKVTVKLLNAVPDMVHIICAHMHTWTGEAFNKVYGTDFMRMFTGDKNHNGYEWKEGLNHCPDWNTTETCGNGLYFIHLREQRNWVEYSGKKMHWKSRIRVPDYTTVCIENGKFKAEHIEVLGFEKI